jgi:hypothetical protein
MPKRYPNPVLREQDTELLAKIAEQHGFFGASEAEWIKFLNHLEANYPINNFSITDYVPTNRFGSDEIPKFYGRDGQHSALVYVLICYLLSLTKK